VLTASDATQYSFEGDQLHGQAVQSVFTRHLVAGLRDGSADLDGDGDITLDELYSYVHDRVVEEMPQQRPKKQDNVEGRTVIARNVNWTLPTYLRNAIRSPIAADRLAALDGLAHLRRIGNDTVRGRVLDEIRGLTDDDSKQVSAAATTLLESLSPQPHETRDVPAPPVAQPETRDVPAPPVAQPAPQPAEPAPPSAADTPSGAADPRGISPRRRQPAPASPPAPARRVPLVDIPNTGAAERSTRPPTSAEPAAESVPGRSTGGPAAGIRSRLKPNTRRAQAVLAVLAVLALTAVVATVVNLANRDTDKPNSSHGSSAPAPVILTGHTDAVTSVAFSPDGKTLAARAANDQVRLWDVASRRATFTFASDYGVTFSPDSKTLVTTGVPDGAVRLWDVGTGRSRATLTGHIGGILVAFSPDGETLATASGFAGDDYDNPVRLWSVATGKLTASLAGPTNGVQSMAFSPDGKALAAGAGGSPSPQVRMWNLATKKVSRTFAAGLLVAFSPDGKTLATSGGGVQQKARLWNVATGQTTATLATDGAPMFSPDGKSIAMNSDDKTVTRWEVATAKSTGSFVGATKVSFSPDSKSIAIVNANKTVWLWDTAAGVSRGMPGDTGNANDAAFSPDGKTIATAGADKNVRIWRLPV
jgi:Tol biopolymer transport system component